MKCFLMKNVSFLASQMWELINFESEDNFFCVSGAKKKGGRLLGGGPLIGRIWYVLLPTIIRVSPPH